MSPWSVVSVVVKGTDWKIAQQDFGHFAQAVIWTLEGNQNRSEKSQTKER